MTRDDFHKLFKSPGPVVLPVIHVTDNDQAVRNVAIVIEEGAAGVFLINHDFAYPEFLPIIRHVRKRYPSLWLGVNFLAVTGREAFPVLGQLAREGIHVDAYWADDACINEHESATAQTEADAIKKIREVSGWHGLYTGGTCFKNNAKSHPNITRSRLKLRRIIWMPSALLALPQVTLRIWENRNIPQSDG